MHMQAKAVVSLKTSFDAFSRHSWFRVRHDTYHLDQITSWWRQYKGQYALTTRGPCVSALNICCMAAWHKPYIGLKTYPHIRRFRYAPPAIGTSTRTFYGRITCLSAYTTVTAMRCYNTVLHTDGIIPFSQYYRPSQSWFDVVAPQTWPVTTVLGPSQASPPMQWNCIHILIVVVLSILLYNEPYLGHRSTTG